MNELMSTNPHYQAIVEYYGDTRAERTGLKYIDHIDEGLVILSLIDAPLEAHEAYCLHPIFQLHKRPEELDIYKKYADELDEESVHLAREYKKYANAYLCKRHYESEFDVVKISDDERVNQMLVADKVQNRKDFEVHYESQSDKETFNRGGDLSQYFKNWLRALGVSEMEYQAHKELLIKVENGELKHLTGL